ncbi:SpoIIE family protein phosphatase [Brevibacillus sp. SYSU BS000544]|uniref:SpoIIE family protein phosphatase n=1 Tax=Brevibacillus sp. SYSU BS000544 TaxID=3416443 RepID=UPI003CE56A98
MKDVPSNWNKPVLQDRGLKKVVLFGSAAITFSILLIGSLVYFFTEAEVLNKLKSRDLLLMAQTMGTKIDGRIERAKETSLVLANDPVLIKWIEKGEPYDTLKEDVFKKIKQIANDYQYSNSFVVSAVTNNYWTHDSLLLNHMSKTNPDDSWFFETLASEKKISVIFDYNEKLNDTYVFVNALVGKLEKPIAVTGVGLSLKETNEDFKSYKIGESSRIWLIDREGTIFLSDNSSNSGHKIGEYLPKQIADQVTRTLDTDILEYNTPEGEIVDTISYPLSSTDLRLVYAIDRSETTSILTSIKYNTIFSVLLSFVSIVSFFYYVSRRIANSYKRTMEINEQLERIVEERTKELEEQNVRILDSISYAKRIQESVLPPKEKLDTLVSEHFLFWRPRDTVGGDFYWAHESEEGVWIGLGDCTGHGVPGALMTMLVISGLNQIMQQERPSNPGEVLKKLNKMIKTTLNKQNQMNILADDGLDLAFVYLQGDTLQYAGAKIPLYAVRNGQLQVIAGSKASIGYSKTADHSRYKVTELSISKGDVFYLATDGLTDQNGGAKGYSFGKKRLIRLIEQMNQFPLDSQCQLIANEVDQFMGEYSQRDDIAVIGFKI